MKKILAAVLGVFLFCASSADAGVYLSAGFGSNENKGKIVDPTENLSDKYKNSPMFSGALGYEASLPFVSLRGELEYLQMKNKLKDADFNKDLKAGMANVYLKLSFLGLYGGVGAGYGKLDGKSLNLYQFMGGWEVSARAVAVGVEYRRTQSGRDIHEDSARMEYKADALLLKMRFTF